MDAPEEYVTPCIHPQWLAGGGEGHALVGVFPLVDIPAYIWETVMLFNQCKEWGLSDIVEVSGVTITGWTLNAFGIIGDTHAQIQHARAAYSAWHNRQKK